MLSYFMISPQKVVKRLFSAGLTAGSCNSLQSQEVVFLNLFLRITEVGSLVQR